MNEDSKTSQGNCLNIGGKQFQPDADGSYSVLPNEIRYQDLAQIPAGTRIRINYARNFGRRRKEMVLIQEVVVIDQDRVVVSAEYHSIQEFYGRHALSWLTYAKGISLCISGGSQLQPSLKYSHHALAKNERLEVGFSVEWKSGTVAEIQKGVESLMRKTTAPARNLRDQVDKAALSLLGTI